MPTVEIETFCRVTRTQVLILLENETEQKGEIVEGRPINCHFRTMCHSTNPDCLLNCLRIESRRK